VLPEWDHLRSEIMTQLSRFGARGDQIPTANVRRMFFATPDDEPYYGPAPEARAEVNALLGLHLTAGQMEWRAELRKPGRIEDALDGVADLSFPLETRSAFALLLLDAIDRMAEHGTIDPELLGRVRWHLRQNPRVQSRMRFFWKNMEGGDAVLATLR
jgi:hypothetical protein